MAHSSPSPLGALARLPLRDVVPELQARLSTLTLAQVEALVRGMSALAAPGREAASAPASLEQVAEVVLALRTPRSKLAELERVVVLHALEVTNGNVSAAARLLGVDRKQVERKVARHRRRSK